MAGRAGTGGGRGVRTAADAPFVHGAGVRADPGGPGHGDGDGRGGGDRPPVAAGVLVLLRREVGYRRPRPGGGPAGGKAPAQRWRAVDGGGRRHLLPQVAEARWAYDGAAQGGKKIAYGNTWVVLALVVRLRFCPSPVALPVLFRLW